MNKQHTKIALIIGITLLISLTASIAQDSRNFYQKNKLQLILRYPKIEKTKQFETYDKWTRQVNDSTLLHRKGDWFVKKSSGERLNSEALFREIGYTDQAKEIATMKKSKINGAMVKMIAGVPLGIGMIAGGVYALNAISNKKDPPPYEKGAAMTISVSGLGIALGSVIHYFTTKGSIKDKHFITQEQALEMVDRHNRTMLSKYKAKKKAKEKSSADSKD